MSTTTTQAGEPETTIPARVLCDEIGQSPAELARYILERDFSERDKARMHDLAVRNQQGTLSSPESEGMLRILPNMDAGATIAAPSGQCQRPGVLALDSQYASNSRSSARRRP